jgi:hypothetical protein
VPAECCRAGLEEALGASAKSSLKTLSAKFGSATARDAGLAALGSLALATAYRFEELKDKRDLDGEKAFADVGKSASSLGVKLYLSRAREDLSKLNSLIDSIAE